MKEVEHTHAHIHTQAQTQTCMIARMLACTHMNNHIYSTLFKIQERESDRRSKDIEQTKESQKRTYKHNNKDMKTAFLSWRHHGREKRISVHQLKKKFFFLACRRFDQMLQSSSGHK